jgi:hypothetical protein
MHHEGHFKVKHIHRFASEYLRSWSPKIGSYQAFNNRLNRLNGVLAKIVDSLIPDYRPEKCCIDQSLMDLMPIITCSGKRSGKVAKEKIDMRLLRSGSYFLTVTENKTPIKTFKIVKK